MSPISNLVLPPLTVAYAAVTRLRLAAYEKGLLRITKLNAPVISVGNITTGGTGKTPLVEWVSRMLAREGRRVSILTRGYGRANAGQQVLVSDGLNVLADVQRSGDEPQLLAENLKGIASVICDSDRAAAGRWAIEHLGTDACVLDDGFQHLQLARDLNILTIDASNPWGGGHLLPYGRMREPRGGISRADCMVITRTEQADDIAALKTEIRQFTGDRPVFTSRMHTSGVRELRAKDPGSIDLLPQPAAAFCAVGNPASFFNHLQAEKIDLAHTRAFPDHHVYEQADIDILIDEARSLGAVSLITTAKDAVKLRQFEFSLPCYVLEIEISIDQHDMLAEMIRTAISGRL